MIYPFYNIPFFGHKITKEGPKIQSNLSTLAFCEFDDEIVENGGGGEIYKERP